MPVVQRYGERKVQTAALPGVQKTSAETPLSQGAGLAEAQGQQAETIGRIAVQQGSYATAQIQKVRDQEDDLVTLAAQNALGKASVDIATRAQEVKGRDTLALPDATTHDFNTVADAIANGLSSDRQREAFAKVRARHDLNLYETVGRHISNEMQSYRSSELKSAIDLGINAVAANALDPRRGKEELDTMIAAVQQQGPAMGWGPAQVADQIADIRSASHIAVVQRLVDNNQPTNAKIYYEETQHEINGDKRGDLEKLLAHGTTRADGQREADAIIAAGGTLAEQRAKVKQITDPDTRAAAMGLVEHEDAVNQKAQRDGEEHLLDDVYARLKANGGNLNSITPSEQLKLGRHLPALKNFSDDLARGVPRKSDKTVYYTMLDQAEREPGNFATLNLRPLLTKLDEADYEHLDKTQRAIRAGNRKAADVELDDFRTERDVVKGALQLAGIDPTPKDTDTEGQNRVARFQTLVAAEVRRVQGDTKKKLGNADVEAIATRVLAVQITDKGWFTDSTRSIGTATPADIPAADLTLIYDSLKRAGQPQTPETALAIWLKAQARKGTR